MQRSDILFLLLFSFISLPMIIHAACLALKRLVTPQFRSMLWQSLGLTFFLLTFIWFVLRDLYLSLFWPGISDFMPYIPHGAGWFVVVTAVFSGFGLAVALAFFIAPITALTGSLFMDEVAGIIEKEDYADEKQGKAMPPGRAVLVSCRFLLLSVAGNVLALVLLLAPGINMVAFLVINGYLLGREYFEFAAARFHSREKVHACYRRNIFTVFLAGLIIALFLSVPILNLITPLFAAAMMTHLHKFLTGSDKRKQMIA